MSSGPGPEVILYTTLNIRHVYTCRICCQNSNMLPKLAKTANTIFIRVPLILFTVL